MRRILTLISLLLAASFIAACGKDGEQTTTVGSGGTSNTVNDDLPLGGGPYPIADLSISFTDAAGNLAEYRLACLGDTVSFTGDVPPGDDAAAACLSVATATARMLLDPDVMVDRMCTEIYGGPETAAIGGLLDGIEVDYKINRTNGCGIDDWERVFAGLIPPHAAQSEPA